MSEIATLNIRDIAQIVSEEVAVPRYKLEAALEKAVDKMVETLLADGEVVLRKALRLYVVDKPARPARNPRTGERINVPPRKKICVAVRGDLKDKLNG